jgi:dCTP deaminase
VILTDREIQIALSKKQIIIEPGPEAEAYSSTSVDLTLDERLSEFKEDWADAVGLETAIDPGQKNFVAEKVLSRITNPVPIPKEGYLLASKKFVLGWTREKVVMPPHTRLAARVEGKSSLARLGLGIHVTAPTIHSGFNLPIRLEIINHGYLPIRLRAGMRICQLIFELTMGTPEKGFTAIQTAPPPEVAG